MSVVCGLVITCITSITCITCSTSQTGCTGLIVLCTWCVHGLFSIELCTVETVTHNCDVPLPEYSYDTVNLELMLF